MRFRLVQELAGDGFDVTVACRVLNVPRSSYYDWASRGPSARAREDARLIEVIGEIHYRSRCTYGAPRVHAELRLGMDSVPRLLTVSGSQTSPNIGQPMGGSTAVLSSMPTHVASWAGPSQTTYAPS